MKCSVRTTIAILAWLTTTLSGTWAMMEYANVPGPAGKAPAYWPEASRWPAPSGRPALVLFLQPWCPCSRASLGELALLLTHAAGRVDARVVFVDPEGQGADWVKTGLWRTAQAIPGLEVERDAGGREAKTFGSATSGEALLYDAEGRLIFQGGITVARGHSGDNPGRSAVEAALRCGATATKETAPVFGCALFSCKSKGRRDP